MIAAFTAWLASLLLAHSPIPATAQSRIAGLTLEQRIAQKFIIHLYGDTITESARDFLTTYQPGGVVLLESNITTPEQITTLVNAYQQAVTAAGGPALFVAVDQEGGPISHLREGFTQFPAPALAAAAGPGAAAEFGAALAAELRAVGVNLNLAPVADLESNPDNPIIARRAWGSRPELAAPALAAFITAQQAAGVLNTAKHFPGHGMTTEDSHVTLPVLALTRERLNTVELVPFRAAIAADVAAVMLAHIVYPALDPDRPASLSPRVVRDLLRDELGYDGLIMTDALDMDAIDSALSYPEAVIQAFAAGVDIALSAHIGPQAHAAAIAAVVQAVRDGRLSEAEIDASVERILAAKARFGLLDWEPLAPDTVTERLPLAASAAAVERLFAEGVSVAFDHTDRLPLSLDSAILVVYPATRPSIQADCALRPDLRWLGVSGSPSPAETAAAAQSAIGVDTVVVFTINAVTDPAQAALVAALPPEKTVAVALWSPYDIRRFPEVAAYLVTYSPLRPAPAAACAVLFGFARGGALSLDLLPPP